MKIRNMIFTAWCACCAMSAAAQDCEISLTIAKAAQKEELPSQVQEILGNRLAAAVAAQGGVANSNFTPFFITAKANTLYKETDTNYKQKQKYSKSFFLTVFSLHICAHLPTPKLLCAIFNRHNLPEYTL